MTASLCTKAVARKIAALSFAFVLAVILGSSVKSQESLETTGDALFKERAQRVDGQLGAATDLLAKLQAATATPHSGAGATSGPGGTFTVTIDKDKDSGQPGRTDQPKMPVVPPDNTAKYKSAVEISNIRLDTASTSFKQAVEMFQESKSQEKSDPQWAASLRRRALERLKDAEKLVDDAGTSLYIADTVTGGRFKKAFLADAPQESQRSSSAGFVCDTACKQLQQVTGTKIGNQNDREPLVHPQINRLDVLFDKTDRAPASPTLSPSKDKILQSGARGNDLRAYDSQQAAVITSDGRTVSVKPLIDALQKVAPQAAKDPFIKVAPQVPGGRPVARFSPELQKTLAENREELRKVGGVALDVTFDNLALAGTPDMRVNGPATLIENPVMISLRRLVAAAQPYVSSPERWRSLPEDIRYPGSLGRVHGYVFDPQTEDVFIVGTVALNREARLDIDLFTVLIDVAWAKGLTPGVSLDPRPGDRKKRYVRIINLPSDALVTKIMLDADYEAKRILCGLVNAPDTKFEKAIRSESTDKDHRTRFWFHPIALNPDTVRISHSGRVVLYDAGVQLLTEGFKLAETGIVALDKVDPVDIGIAEEFTRAYSYFESSFDVRPQGVYSVLHGITDLVTMFKILRESRIDFPVLNDLRQLPYRHMSGAEEVPTSYPAVDVRVSGNSKGTEIQCTGGIDLRSRPTRRSLDRFDDYVVSALESAASNFSGNGFSQKLHMTFVLSRQQTGSSAEAEQVKQAGLRQLAVNQPLEASRRFREATVIDSADIDAWIYLGLAEAKAGQFVDAREAMKRAEAIDANDAVVKKVGFQVEWLANPRLNLESIDPILRREISIEYADAAVFAQQRNDGPSAIENATKAIDLWSDNVDAYVIRGMNRFAPAEGRRDVSGARADYDNAIKLFRNGADRGVSNVGDSARTDRIISGLLLSRSLLRVAAAAQLSITKQMDENRVALSDATEASRLDPENEYAQCVVDIIFKVMFDIADEVQAQPDWSEQLTYADDQIRRLPNLACTRAFRAQILLRMKRLTAAEDDLNAAVSIGGVNAGETATFYHDRSIVRAALRKCDAARKDLEYALKQNSLITSEKKVLECR